ncbi:MAG: hypothetical protein ACOC14_00255 [Bacillota bacterium]
MHSLNRDILVATIFAVLAFLVILIFTIIGFASNLGTGALLLRNYGIALGAISIVFTRTASRENLDVKNATVLNIAFKAGIFNTVFALGMMIILLLLI